MGTARTPSSRPNDHDQFLELVAAYALDAVDADEVEPIEIHLDTCDECRHELRQHLEVLALVGATTGIGAPAPPVMVWTAIHDHVRAGSTGSSPTPTAPPLDSDNGRPDGFEADNVVSLSGRAASPSRRSSAVAVSARRPLQLVAAALVLLTGVFGVASLRQSQRIDQLDAEVAAPSIDRAAQVALADTGNRVTTLVSADGRPRARVALLRDGTGYLVPTDLSGLPADRSYQLWGVSGDDQPRPVSLGLLGASPRATAFHTAPHLTSLAVTDEPAAGSPGGPTTAVLASATIA